MGVNRGKQFEQVIKTVFENVPDTVVTRLYDSTAGFLGVNTHCDFIVYHYPYEYHIECKSVYGNTLPFSNITKNQWRGLLDVSKKEGVIAGVICWWIDKDVTKFIPIEALEHERFLGAKSVRYDSKLFSNITIQGKKKHIFFDYDMQAFFKEAEERCYMK